MGRELAPRKRVAGFWVNAQRGAQSTTAQPAPIRGG